MRFLLLCLLNIPLMAFAHLERIESDKPLFEYGVIGASGYVPDYPASDQGRVRWIAAPMVRYRGLRFRSDEEDSVKARLFNDAIYGFDLSAGGSFQASSEKNDARKGMPDLDWTLELGPRFYVFLYKSERVWLRFFAPVRVAFSTDLTDLKYQGLVLAPSINLRMYVDETKFNSIILGVTRTHTTAELQKFFFEVDSKYATPERPRYEARSGYMSTSAGLAYIYEKGNKGFYTGFGASSYQGAANAGSPLHKTDLNFGWFLGFSYLFYQSEARGYQ